MRKHGSMRRGRGGGGGFVWLEGGRFQQICEGEKVVRNSHEATMI